MAASTDPIPKEDAAGVANETEASDSDSGSNSQASPRDVNKPDPPGVGLQNELVQDLVPSHLGRGVLIPLKTTLEVRQDHTLVQAYITRAPTKSANDVVT
jgi:tRNA-specific adenosine deaminase 3